MARKTTQTTTTLPETDHDSPWKDMLELYFPAFIAFFFPHIFEDIDWSRGYEFLDKEFQRIVRDAKLGRRLVDKLVKVWLKSGEEVWILIHIEVQGKVEADFSKRMYIYNYRIFDKYERTVVSLAILADSTQSWRPNKFRSGLLGCEASLRFPIVKLLDYKKKWAELEASDNPFAIVTMAHLKTQETTNHLEERRAWKFTLVKRLYERGFSHQDILELFRFIDWVMVLPEELANQFEDDLEKYEEEQKMPYVTHIERRGIERGQQQTSSTFVLEALKIRFGAVSEALEAHILSIKDTDLLRTLFRKAMVASSPEEFAQGLAEVSA